MSADVVDLPPVAERPLSWHVAANIRAEIARRGLQQAEVAKALGISQQSVSLKIHGRRPLALDEIAGFAALFGMEAYELLKWAPWGSNPQPAD